MTTTTSALERKLKGFIERRRTIGTLRQLQVIDDELIDFFSNDYLCFAQNEEIQELIRSRKKHLARYQRNGSTGSRLISGNSSYAMQVEKNLATFYNSDAALIFSSGYMANLGVLSSLPQENDIILYDELIHNSCHEGMRLSRAYTKGNSFAFRHNDVTSLLSLLTSKHTTLKGNGIIYVVVESLYSMDGDIAPLKEMALLSEEFGAFLIVDEAHSVGVYGPHGSGILCEIGIDAFPNVIAARVYTFGKAMGCHGAVVCGSKNLIEYLVNYARSVIYTTAPSFDQLVTIECIHEYCAKADDARQKLRKIVSYFKENIQQNLQIPKHVLVPSDSAIQGIFFQGNHQILAAAKYMNQKGIQIIPIRSPTVPKGMERFRIVLHAHNTKAQVDQLINTIAKLFENETIAKL